MFSKDVAIKLYVGVPIHCKFPWRRTCLRAQVTVLPGLIALPPAQPTKPSRRLPEDTEWAAPKQVSQEKTRKQACAGKWREHTGQKPQLSALPLLGLELAQGRAPLGDNLYVLPPSYSLGSGNGMSQAAEA